MDNLIKTEKLFGGNKVLVGTPSADLVLQSLGKVYIQSGKSIKLLSDIIKELVNIDTSKVIISDNPNIKYESEGQLVFNSVNQTLYLGVNGQLIPIVEAQGHEGNYVKKTGDVMSGTLYLDSEDTPLKINSNQLINNLNSEYLEGHHSKDFTQKNENETITGKWEYHKPQLFKKKIIVDDVIGSPNYQSGFQGFGWQLDSETNTLTIDNLVVRKILKVFELVVNKISATNGSLWVTNSTKIKNVFLVESQINNNNFSIQKGQYLLGRSIYNGNYLKTKYGIFPLPDKENNKYIIDSLNATITKCNSDYENTGKYKVINIYDEYFKKYQLYFNDNLFVIEVDEPVFSVGDLLRCQKMNGINVSSYNLIVLQVLWGTGKGQVCLVQSDSSLSLQPEDTLVQYGNISNTKRQGSYYITSIEDNSPYSLVISGANTPDYAEPYKTPLFNLDGTVQQKDGKYLYTYIKPVKVRVGKLDGQWDNFYLDNNGKSKIKGWGLYGQDVFLTGEFHLNNGVSVVDFTREGILLSFKNAGLEIKEISPGNNGIILNANQIQINTIDSSGNTKQAALFKDGYISADLIKALKLESKEKINGVSAWALNEDGSGHLAGNNITWDTSGNVVFTGEINAKKGKIAGIQINNGYLGTKDNNSPASLYLDSSLLAFNKILENRPKILLNGNEDYQHRIAYIGTQFDPLTRSYLLKLEDNLKYSQSKSGLVIDIRNSIEDNKAISILGGTIAGLRLATHTIENDDETLDKLHNYVLFKGNGNLDVYLPKVEQCDLGLTYIISNVSTSNTTRLEINCNNSKFTSFSNESMQDVSMTQADTIILNNDFYKNFVYLEKGQTVLIILTSILHDGKIVWTAKYL